ERFATPAARYENSAECVRLLEVELPERTTAGWLVCLEAGGVPCAPINSLPAALADEHAAARGLLISTAHPRFGTVRQVASAARAGAPRCDHRRAPSLGEHTREVLEQLLDMDAGEIDALARAGAFGEQERTRWTSH